MSFKVFLIIKILHSHNKKMERIQKNCKEKRKKKYTPLITMINILVNILCYLLLTPLPSPQKLILF